MWRAVLLILMGVLLVAGVRLLPAALVRLTGAAYYDLGASPWHDDELVFVRGARLDMLETTLYRADLESEALTPLDTNGPLHDPAWSPEGGQIVYSVYDGPGGQADLFLWADGTSRQLTATPDLNEIQPTWSPDGGRIAYYTTDARDYAALMVLDLSDNTTSRLTEALRYPYEFPPEWSPGGRMIALPGEGVNRVYDAITGDIIAEAEIDGVQIKHNNWSPDGEAVAFFRPAALDDDSERGIYLLDVTTNEVSLLSGQVGNIVDMTWSPDGEIIAYMVDGGAAGKRGRRIYLLQIDKPDIRLLTDLGHQYNEFMFWSPDSTRLVFGGRHRLYIIDAITGIIETSF